MAVLLVFLFADDCMGIPLTNLSVKKSIPEMNECLPSCRAESTHKGVKQRRMTSHKHNNKSESPTITLTWHACKYKVHKLHERYILFILFIFIFLTRDTFVPLVGQTGEIIKQLFCPVIHDSLFRRKINTL